MSNPKPEDIIKEKIEELKKQIEEQKKLLEPKIYLD